MRQFSSRARAESFGNHPWICPQKKEKCRMLTSAEKKIFVPLQRGCVGHPERGEERQKNSHGTSGPGCQWALPGEAGTIEGYSISCAQDNLPGPSPGDDQNLPRIPQGSRRAKLPGNPKCLFSRLGKKPTGKNMDDIVRLSQTVRFDFSPGNGRAGGDCSRAGKKGKGKENKEKVGERLRLAAAKVGFGLCPLFREPA